MPAQGIEPDTPLMLCSRLVQVRIYCMGETRASKLLFDRGTNGSVSYRQATGLGADRS